LGRRFCRIRRHRHSVIVLCCDADVEYDFNGLGYYSYIRDAADVSNLKIITSLASDIALVII
jgi:hypothetical protein